MQQIQGYCKLHQKSFFGQCPICITTVVITSTNTLSNPLSLQEGGLVFGMPDVPEEVKEWIKSQGRTWNDDNAFEKGARAMYHKFVAELKDFSLADAIKQIDDLQASLSSMKAERDKLLLEEENDALRWSKEYKVITDKLEQVTADRELFKNESESYRKAWEEATAILSEIDIEMTMYKQALKSIIDHLNGGSDVYAFGLVHKALSDLLIKYEKEESKQ